MEEQLQVRRNRQGRRDKGYTIASNKAGASRRVDDSKNGRYTRVLGCGRERERKREVRRRNFGLSSPIQLGQGKNVTREKEFRSSHSLSDFVFRLL